MTEKLLARINHIENQLAQLKKDLLDKRKEGVNQLPLNLQSELSFNNFIVSDTMKAVSYSVASNIGEKSLFNPLYLYEGKHVRNHIINAIGNHALSKNPELEAHLVTGEEFANTLKSKQDSEEDLLEYIKQLKSLELLMISDIQDITEETDLEVLFDIVTDFYTRGVQLVLTSDREIAELTHYPERLVTRLYWGLEFGEKSSDLT